MYGLEAIAHYNGWAMAGAGALIVVSGLAVLSFIISQFPRIVALLEKRDLEPGPAASPPNVEPRVPDRCPADINETGRVYRQMSSSLGNEFDLEHLYQLCQEKNHPHPHLTIKCLREAGILIARGEGVFSWKA